MLFFLCFSSFNYDLYVKDVIKYKWDSGDNPIRQKSAFSELTLREKVEVIHSICEYRLDGEDVMELLKVNTRFSKGPRYCFFFFFFFFFVVVIFSA